MRSQAKPDGSGDAATEKEKVLPQFDTFYFALQSHLLREKIVSFPSRLLLSRSQGGGLIYIYIYSVYFNNYFSFLSE